MGAQWKHAGRVAAGNARGRVFSKLAKELILAARAGADPAHNVRLRLVVEAAKRASMPKDTIERSIKRGAGLLDDAAAFETVIYEGFAPHRVPVMVECLTDNRNRTTTSVRVLFRRGQLGAAGSVSWDFSHLGFVDATPGDGAAAPDDAAIEAGAQDVEPGEEPGTSRFYTEPADLDAVQKALAAAGWTIDAVYLGYRPKNPVAVDDAARAEVVAFLEALDADDDVQRLYVGLA